MTVGGVRDDQDEVPLPRPGQFQDRPDRVAGQELRDRALDVTRGIEREVGEATRPEPLGPLGQVVDLAARRAAHPGCDDRRDPPAARQCAVEHAEAGGRPAVRVRQRARQVDELHPEPKIGLVRPVALHGLVVGESRERDRLDRPLRRGGARDLDGHRLDEGHDGVLVDEAHLQVQLGELRLAVAAQVLVAVAAGDLEVAIDTTDHQQLLELLRALGQGVHATGLESRRDDEVAGTFRRALDQRRRFHLYEPRPVVRLPDRLDHPRAKHQPLRHRLAADVEIAVPEPQDLVDRGVRIVDVEGRRLRLRQDAHLQAAKFDRAGRQPGVLRAGQPRCHLTDDLDHELATDATADLVCLRRVVAVDDDLGDPVPVAQVQEDQLPVIPAPVDPAGQARAATRVGRAERPAGMRPIGRGEAGGGVGHGRRIVDDRRGRPLLPVRATPLRGSRTSRCRRRTGPLRRRAG